MVLKFSALSLRVWIKLSASPSLDEKRYPFFLFFSSVEFYVKQRASALQFDHFRYSAVLCHVLFKPSHSSSFCSFVGYRIYPLSFQH